MSGAREEVLGRIRQALAGSPQGRRYDMIVRDYRQAGALESEERIQLFEERLRDYGAGVRRCASDELPKAIEEIISQRGRSLLVVSKAFRRRELPDLFEFRTDDGLSYTELDHCDGAITFCALGIAMTGTIVLRHSEEEGRRALTLIPDYHLCIVREDQVVETVVEGIRVMARWGRVPITIISGPSATSDIEMTRVKGVHGPRTLDVIIAGGQSPL